RRRPRRSENDPLSRTAQPSAASTRHRGRGGSAGTDEGSARRGGSRAVRAWADVRINVPVWTVAAGGSLLALGFGLAAQSARTSIVRADDQDAMLSSTSHTVALQMAEQVERGRTIAVMLAQNPVFADFYTSPGTRADKIAHHLPVVAATEDALRGLYDLVPGGIGEACFIDASGAENSRIVDGVAAKAADLSQDESKNPFFSPTMAMTVGHVYQAVAYVSGDTGDWVVSHATPI